jgi:DNA-binding beta-propeller fold protein YncE
MRDESGISEYSISSSGGLASERIGPVSDGPLLGMAVSPNGRELVAAGASGASVFSVSRIEQAGSAPSSWLVGTFTSHGQGAIEAAVSPDGHYVFVSLEDSDQLAVFNLGKAERSGFGHTDLVGYVPMGVAPVGMTISPDGRYLYATSEAATESGTQGTLTTVWASSGLTDIQHQGHGPGKDVQNGDHGEEEAATASLVHSGVQS